MFKPNIERFDTQIRIKHRKTTMVSGSPKFSYEDADPALDFCGWKSKGGTENTASGTLVIEDTAEVTMWYRSDVKKHDMVLLDDNVGFSYEVIGEPENVENRNMHMILKVRRVST